MNNRATQAAALALTNNARGFAYLKQLITDLKQNALRDLLTAKESDQVLRTGLIVQAVHKSLDSLLNAIETTANESLEENNG